MDTELNNLILSIADTVTSLEKTEEHSLSKNNTSIHAYLQAATSHNTRSAYQADIRHFFAWGGVLPASPDVLLQYLQQHAATLNPRTLKRRLVAIKQWHACQGFPDPTSHPLIRKTLSGIFHLHGKPAEKALPFTPEQLVQMVSYLRARGKLSDLRDIALLQTGFFGAFRRSELVAICWDNIRYVPQGMEIIVMRSKTDQLGDGKVCAIPYGNNLLCPIKALQQWQEAVSCPEGYVFRRISKGGQIAEGSLTGNSVNRIIKSLVLSCQLPQAEHYSAHSLRRGFATAASQQGASFGAIMRHGRWRHEGTVHGYIEEGQLFNDNAATSILDGVKKSNET